MKDKKVYKFKENDKEELFQASMQCMHNMDHDARIWTLVHIISSVLSDNNVTYDEFYEIISAIDHYTHHYAEFQQHIDVLSYKREEGIDIEDEIDEEEFEIDLNGEDGEWFEIPVIG